jgi:hypothetical protein
VSTSRHRPPPEEDLQPTTRDELHKPPVQSNSRLVPATDAAHASLAPERRAYFTGSYAPGGRSTSRAGPLVAHDLMMHELLAKFGLPESLEPCVARLIAIGRSHGSGEAMVAAGKDPALDSALRENARRLLSFVFYAPDSRGV